VESTVNIIATNAGYLTTADTYWTTSTTAIDTTSSNYTLTI